MREDFSGDPIADPGRPDPALALAEQVRARRALGDREGAMAALASLQALWPDAAAVHDARGVLLAEAGRLDDARAAFLAALASDPAFARAHFGLASLGPVAPAHRARMEALAASAFALDPGARAFLLYALAKAYDEAGDAERAFACAEAGARLRGGPSRKTAGVVLRRLARAGPLPPESWSGGDAGVAPIFVIGLPRSGTTLVEQILASHPGTHALGECEAFASVAARKRSPARRAAAYLDALPDMGGRRPLDKSLGNVLHVGALREAFPAARFVHVRRDPLDNGLSIFFSHFGADTPFAPDLFGIGRYMRAHGALMEKWRAALPATMWRTVDYERLVDDGEGETRALLEFCGLDFDARCLAFHATQRPVATASLAQVRRPLYRSSVGRARAYARWLGPLREEFA